MKIVDQNGVSRDCLEIKPDKNFPGYFAVTYPSKRNPSKHITEWYPIADFKRLNPELKEIIKQASPQAPDSIGVVSHSDTESLKDVTQKWTVNAYMGFTVWISRGLGEGQTRIVVSNTKNKAIIDKPWDVIPDKTSQFVISRDIKNPPPMENQLPNSVN